MPPKIECRMELWWINSALLEREFGCAIYGDVFGHPGYQDGEFTVFEVIRADFTNAVVETNDAYVKLGERQSLERVLARLNADEVKKK